MTLTIQDLGALGELLGSVAVLATLVYLALQTRQNTMAIGAQLDAAVLSARLSTFLSVATSGDLAEALNEDSTAPRTTNETRRDTYWFTTLMLFHWQFRQARRGLLPSFNEAGMALRITNLFDSFRSFEGYWQRAKPGYFPEFVEEHRPKAA